VDLGELEISSLNDVFATEAGAAAANVVNLQNERAHRRADNGVRRSHPRKRRA
jgi:hypothetical protein